MQIIVLTALFRIDIPDNADMIMMMILRLCSLDFASEIFVDDVIEIFDFKETESFQPEKNEKEDEEGEEDELKYEEAGFEGSNFFELIGPILIIAVVFFFYSVTKLSIKFCTRRCGNNFFTRFFRKRIEFSVIILRFFLEGCLEIGNCAMISVLMMTDETYDSFWEGVSTTSAFISLVCLFIAPLVLLRFINNYLKEIRETGIAEQSKHHKMFE